MSDYKTEFIFGFSIAGSTKEIVASVCIDGMTKWTLNAELTPDFVGTWSNFFLTHNGTEPTLYVNGSLYPFSFSVPDYKSFWIASLFSESNDSKAKYLILSSTLRNYYPYYVSGFSGELDKVKMWNINLTPDVI